MGYTKRSKYEKKYKNNEKRKFMKNKNNKKATTKIQRIKIKIYKTKS